MKDQLPLPFASTRVLSTEPFFISACNAEAVRLVEGAWPGGALALVGPEGSGKTHLANRWAVDHGAVFLDQSGNQHARSDAFVIEDADRWPATEGLFHLLNRAQGGEIFLLLTSRLRPTAWRTPLADLRSRLNALPVAELHEADDALLAQVLRGLFRERFIVPADDLIPYLLKRMERSFAAARDVVERLHAKGLAEGRSINRSLAARELEVASVINDLFDDRV